jgi:hypothetical protein
MDSRSKASCPMVREPEAAGFAVFGTFAHLVMVDYATTG